MIDDSVISAMHKADGKCRKHDMSLSDGIAWENDPACKPRSSVQATDKRRDAIPIPATPGEQAFRLLYVLEQIGKLQFEKNILEQKLQEIPGLHVAHGAYYDVVFQNGKVTKAAHAKSPPLTNPGIDLVKALNADAPEVKVLNGALQAALIAARPTMSQPGHKGLLDRKPGDESDNWCQHGVTLGEACGQCNGPATAEVPF